MDYAAFVSNDSVESKLNPKADKSNNQEGLANKLRHAYSEILNKNINTSLKRQLSFQKSNQSIDKNTTCSYANIFPVDTSNKQNICLSDDEIINIHCKKSNNKNVIGSFKQFKITPTDESLMEGSINRNYANRLRESSRKLLSHNFTNKRPTQMSKEILNENKNNDKTLNKYHLKYVASNEVRVEPDKKTIKTPLILESNFQVQNKEPIQPSYQLNSSDHSFLELSEASKNYLQRKQKLQSARIDVSKCMNETDVNCMSDDSTSSILTINSINRTHSNSEIYELNGKMHDNESLEYTMDFKNRENGLYEHKNNIVTMIGDEDQSNEYYQTPQIIDIDTVSKNFDYSLNDMNGNNGVDDEDSSSDRENNGDHLIGIPGFDKSMSVNPKKSILKVSRQNSIDNFENYSNINNDSKKSKRIKIDPVSVILDAASDGDVQTISYIFQQINDCSVSNRLGATPLHLSICSFKYEATQLLVELGADVNFSDINGWTPLHCAAFYCDLWTCRLLVKNGSNIRASTTSDSKTPIDICRSQIKNELNTSFKKDEVVSTNECLQYLMDELLKLQSINCGTVVYACYERSKIHHDELSININDKLIVSVQHKSYNEIGWIWVENSIRQFGFVPENYITIYPRTLADV